MAGPSSQPTSRLSPACQGQVCLTCLANDQSHVSETGLKLRQLLSLSDVPQPLSPATQTAEAMGGLLAAGQPDYAAGCAWNLGWAGWAELCLGGLLDGQGLLGLRLGGELLAGLGLRPVADT